MRHIEDCSDVTKASLNSLQVLLFDAASAGQNIRTIGCFARFPHSMDIRDGSPQDIDLALSIDHIAFEGLASLIEQSVDGKAAMCDIQPV